ncbi:hypothetical protein [Actinomadura hibisca]|uniref:hypothetical protein n=1 Tax=Actinomadura hibisca TaxID=68565 RepID=UPI0008295F01|nr:hypothetical protein [Actinomadura hibisca]
MTRTGALAAAALLAGACTPTAGASGDLRPSGTNPPAPPPPEAAPTDAASVLTRYRLFHEVLEHALETNDTKQIRTVATSEAASRLLAAVRRNRRAGVVQRSHAVPRPRVAALRARTADIIDCVSTSGLWTYRKKTATRVGAPPRSQRYLLYVSMARTPGGWKVARIVHPRDPRC